MVVELANVLAFHGMVALSFVIGFTRVRPIGCYGDKTHMLFGGATQRLTKGVSEVKPLQVVRASR